ncbi:MAG: hypothetical protein Q7S44_00675 [bacterium]|nr:hypothetical protein [bacterium]
MSIESIGEMDSRPDVILTKEDEEIVRGLAHKIWLDRTAVFPSIPGTDVNDWIAAKAELFRQGKLPVNHKVMEDRTRIVLASAA